MARYADVKLRIGKEAVADAPGGNVTVNIPGPVVKDEIIIIAIVSDDNVSSSSSGYTAKIETNAGTTCRATVLYKRAVGGETSVTVTHTVGETIAGIALVARGVVKTGDPFEASGATGTQNSATVTFPSVTTLTPKALVLAIGGLTTDEDTSGGATWGAMSGEGNPLFTADYSFTNGTLTDTVAMGLYEGLQNQVGATTSRTVTIAGGLAAQDQVGTILALTPETLPDPFVHTKRHRRAERLAARQPFDFHSPYDFLRYFTSGVTVAAGSDVSVALTGVSSTASVGTVGVAHDNSLTGESSTAAVGTVVPSTTVTLTGVASTASVGTLAPGTSVALVGVSATGQVGVVLTGVVTAASVGSVTPSSTVPLTGVSSTASVGTVGVSVTVAITGVASTASVGTLTPNTTVPLTGVFATGAVGTVSAGGDVTVALTGEASITAVGTVVPSGGDVVAGGRTPQIILLLRTGKLARHIAGSFYEELD